MKWSKLLTNLIANATSAILDMTAPEVFADSKLYALEIGMLRECLAVMDVQGIPVVDLPGTPVRLLEFAARLPFWLSKPLFSRAAGSGRGRKLPSFHIDLYSGRGTSEVEYLNGAVVQRWPEIRSPDADQSIADGNADGADQARIAASSICSATAETADQTAVAEQPGTAQWAFRWQPIGCHLHPPLDCRIRLDVAVQRGPGQQ